jgi:outer membrane lipopolysaccharide assembly protein LptE/RlpB
MAMHLHHRDTEASIFDPIPTKAGLDQNSHPFGKGRNISCPKGAESLTFSLRSLRLCGEILWVFLLVVLCGCGYQLAGKSSHLPAGVTSLAIPTFSNQTLEPGIEVPLTQSFLREFMFDGRIKILSPKEANTTLEGSIKNFRIRSVSYDESGLAQEYQVAITVDLTLTKSSGEIVWKENNLTEVRWYRASFGGVINEASKNSAVQELGKFMAERVKSRFFYNF